MNLTTTTTLLPSSNDSTSATVAHTPLVELKIWLPPFLVLVGIILNILTLAVMLRRRFRSLSSSVYLLTLAVVDIICLLVDFKLMEWIRHIRGVSTMFPNRWVCYLVWWLAQFPYSISSWMIVAVTVERVIIVCVPLKAKILCTRRKSWITVVMIVVLMMAIGLIHPFLVDGQTCTAKDKDWLPVLFSIPILLYSIVPFFIIAICNVTIVIQLVRQREVLSDISSTTSAKAQSDAQRLTGMLITNSCVFLILTLPYNTLLAYKQVFNIRTVSQFWMTFTHYLVTLNHCINFLLYTISGSFYRRELKQMLLGWRSRGYKRGLPLTYHHSEPVASPPPRHIIQRAATWRV